MDTELIKMCDCPEIQDRWEPKGSDRVHDGDQDCNYWYVTRVFENGRMSIIAASGIAEDNMHRKNCTYIPRIEDVLEWLVPTHCHTWKNALDMAMGIDRHVPKMPSNIGQALLMVYMYWQEDKSWNGEAWA